MEETEYYVTSISDVNGKRRRVFINYEPAFVLYTSEIRRLNIKKDTYMTAQAYEEAVAILNKRAKIRAMALLKDRDYTRKKLEEKLKDSGYPKESIDKAIEYVDSYGYINDRRYADNYIISRSATKSKRAIQMWLSNQGVSSDIINAAIDDFYNNEDDVANPELDLIIKQLKTKYYNKDLKDYEQRQKVKASLYRKGFMSDNINKALDIVVNNEKQY